MYLLIDPPVGPYDPPERMRAWLEELGKSRERHAGDVEALTCIAVAEAQARQYLAAAGG